MPDEIPTAGPNEDAVEDILKGLCDSSKVDPKLVYRTGYVLGQIDPETGELTIISKGTSDVAP